MNAQVRQLADSIGWAFADLDAVFSGFTVARSSYSASEELGCAYPYGAFVSLDGVHPNVVGHQSIANVVAAAINAKYGFEIPVVQGISVTRAVLCP
jgi:lysophospholipase L1-like esterase